MHACACVYTHVCAANIHFIMLFSSLCITLIQDNVKACPSSATSSRPATSSGMHAILLRCVHILCLCVIVKLKLMFK